MINSHGKHTTSMYAVKARNAIGIGINIWFVILRVISVYGQYVFLWHFKHLPFDAMFVYCLLIFDLYDWFTQGNHSSYAHISNECLCKFCLRDQFICHSCQWISYICCVLNLTIILSNLYIVIVNISNLEWSSIHKINSIRLWNK